jgi:hypothetical protein
VTHAFLYLYDLRAEQYLDALRAEEPPSDEATAALLYEVLTSTRVSSG